MILGWFTSLFAKTGSKWVLAGLIAAAVAWAVLTMFTRVQDSGKALERAKSLGRIADAARKKAEADARLGGMSDAEIRARAKEIRNDLIEDMRDGGGL